MSTALIVPFGADNSELGRARAAIWKRCRALWEDHAPSYTIVVASDPLFGQPLHKDSEGGPCECETHPFSVARAINNAVRLAPPEVDKFVCIGADALPDWRVVQWASAELDARPWTLLFGKGASVPTERLGALDIGMRAYFLDEVHDFEAPCVGPIAFTRAAFMGVRGYDERFEGWAYEDVDLWCRLRYAYPKGGTGATSPYPLIQFAHPDTHHDLTDANPNVRLWRAKCDATWQFENRPNDHPAPHLFDGGAIAEYRP